MVDILITILEEDDNLINTMRHCTYFIGFCDKQTLILIHNSIESTGQN